MKPAGDHLSTRARAGRALDSRAASAALVGLISITTVATSIGGAPGIGVLVALLIIGVVLWLRGKGLREIGFSRVASRGRTLLLGVILGTLIQLGSTLLFDPFIENVTGTPIDLTEFEHIRGDAGALLTWLLIVWLLVVFVEEIIFRGFLMTELDKLLGEGRIRLWLNVMLASTLFGVAHWYQGLSGVLSTGLIGLLLGGIFIRSGFNLWLPILVHGFIDTVGLTMIYLSADLYFNAR